MNGVFSLKVILPVQDYILQIGGQYTASALAEALLCTLASIGKPFGHTENPYANNISTVHEPFKGDTLNLARNAPFSRAQDSKPLTRLGACRA